MEMETGDWSACTAVQCIYSSYSDRMRDNSGDDSGRSMGMDEFCGGRENFWREGERSME